MTALVARPLVPGEDVPLDIDVDRVMFDADRLVVTIASLSAKKSWTVTFAATLGHRVLDEGDLLEFWPHCSRPNGWLFQIDAGGWFEQECARQGFLARDTQSGIQEYFVAGDNTCVNVLSWEPPKGYAVRVLGFSSARA